MYIDLKTTKGIADYLETFKIPAEIYKGERCIRVVTRRSEVDKVDLLLNTIGGLPMSHELQIEGSLPWYKNRFKLVKIFR